MVGIAMHLSIDHHTLVEALCLKIMPPLLSVHHGNVVQSVGRNKVVLAMDFDLDLERLVVVLQCLWILALFVKDCADAAQQ